MIGILSVFSWISLTAYCSHIVRVGHSGVSISVITSLCFFYWAVISHSEEVLWSHVVSAALLRWKTDFSVVSSVSSYIWYFWPVCFCQSAWFSPCKFMVFTPNHLLVLHVLESRFQDCSLHQEQASRPVVAWLLLLVLENRFSLTLVFLSPLSCHPSA